MRFLRLLLVAFLLLEIVLLIKVGGQIGTLTTVAWLVMAVFFGVNLLRIQGIATLVEARSLMERGETPAFALANGLLMAMAGVLLIFPGFASDVLAILCLIPAVRRLAIRRWTSKVGNANTYRSGNVYDADAYSHQNSSATERISPSAGQTLDGEFKRED
jgi:UPF0716 protein FxsA